MLLWWYTRKLPEPWRHFESFLNYSVSELSIHVLRANVGGFPNLPSAYVCYPDSDIFEPLLLDNDDLWLEVLSI
jgi:hypothetical protein